MRISDWSSDVCSSDLAVGAYRLRRRKAGRCGQRDDLFRVFVDVLDFRIETIDAVGHDADAADEHAVLVERQAARIGAEAERRAFGTNEAVRGGRAVEAGGEVGARGLAELDAEQRSAFEPARGGREIGRAHV